MANIKILNEFGIKPSNTYTSAGADFYVPNISLDKANAAYDAFVGSYGISKDDILTVIRVMSKYINIAPDKFTKNVPNFVQLYLSLDSYDINMAKTLDDKIKVFAQEYLIFDNNDIPGVQLKTFDMMKINSGIRVALEPNTAGIFFNKSGKGTAGFDVRAQVVDEDYTGFVHLSLQYLRKSANPEDPKARVFCGDKLTQMVILPLNRMNAEEVSFAEYFDIMKDSKRGSQAFGHSDIVH